MSFPHLGDKALPEVPVDIDDNQTRLEHKEERWLMASSKIAHSANTSKTLPSINVENTLSGEEMSRLHELWNEAGLSARAHRRRRRDQNRNPRRIPAPISIPEPEDIAFSMTCVDTSFTNTTTPTTAGSRKRRWGFLTPRPISEKQEVEKRSSNALGILRAMKKRVRYARSAPNLSDEATAAKLKRAVTLQPAVPGLGPVEATLEDAPANNLSPTGELATSEVVLRPEEKDVNAIYFSIDPTWRTSQGSMRFQFITPIPDSPTFLERPDSPLEHRHYSLDQLSLATRKNLAATEFPASDPVLDAIDELHSYLGL